MAKNPPQISLLRLLPAIPSESLSRDALNGVDPRQHPLWRGGTALWSTGAIELSDDALRVGLYASMRMRESMLLRKVFSATLNQPDPYPLAILESVRAELSQDYKFFGLARGQKHADELIRRLQTAAADQAREQSGFTRT